MGIAEPTAFDAEEIAALRSLLTKLGPAVAANEFVADSLVADSLVAVAHNYYCLLLSASLSPTVAQVRADLRRLATRLKTGAPLPDRMCTEAFNALLGCYPASTYDIFPFADRATDGRQPLALAFPSEVAASHDILSGARSNPDFNRQIVLVWQWHKRGAVVDKFLGRNLVAKGRVFYRDLASATLENRLATFTALEIADLIKAVEWAIARMKKTCIPRQANPRPKKSFGWAVGNVERILIAEVVSVLWSDQVPEGASTEHVAEIVDLTRSKVVDDGVVAEHADVAYLHRDWPDEVRRVVAYGRIPKSRKDRRATRPGHKRIGRHTGSAAWR